MTKIRQKLSSAGSWLVALSYGFAQPRFRRALAKALWRSFPFVVGTSFKKNRRSKWPLIQKISYELLSELNTDPSIIFMNLGYAGLETPHISSLTSENEANRFSIQLYDYLIKFSDPKEKDVLEVGCGRGGGASFLFKTYQPKSYLGIDFADANIAFCNEVLSKNGLRFEVGRAESLSVPDCSKDIIINIESSHCYTSPHLFFIEVQRILKPGGIFLFADIRGDGVAKDYQTVQMLEDQFKVLEDMTLLHRINITKNVTLALELAGEAQVKRWFQILWKNLDQNSKSQQFIERVIEPGLRGVFSPHVPKSAWSWYNFFKEGKAEYWSYVFQKKNTLLQLE